LLKNAQEYDFFTLKGGRLKDITYTDDKVLMAHTFTELQLLIDYLKRFCTEVGTEIDVDK
jgi:hypothetical protein